MNYFELKSKFIHGVLWERFYERDFVYQSNVLNFVGIIESELVPYQNDPKKVFPDFKKKYFFYNNQNFGQKSTFLRQHRNFC